ncbi:STAS domain-containing protein [Kibdelosporangium philippinense]|uniref:STAS domain-containing protein n=2 Tax=Kibdelosporangium philippinense TaxID=211113 RepID=A0ABS8Z8S2_9PSEU|nr:STAS domain-containing protein [Kibdelosporangium philippinense]MCE7004290.1 STAS domain-containing protein [Kibdelosporangium philippinense]
MNEAGDGLTHSPSVLSLRGEVDVATGQHFATQLSAALTTCGGVLFVDLLKISFLGSAGLAALIRFQDEAALRGVEVRLVCGPASRRTIELTGLAQRFTLVDTVPAGNR